MKIEMLVWSSISLFKLICIENRTINSFKCNRFNWGPCLNGSNLFKSFVEISPPSLNWMLIQFCYAFVFKGLISIIGRGSSIQISIDKCFCINTIKRFCYLLHWANGELLLESQLSFGNLCNCIHSISLWLVFQNQAYCSIQLKTVFWMQ